MIPMLYDCFKHWAEKGSVYLISDPHFDDADCQYMNPNWPTPAEYVDKINSVVTKNDTLICLGDCGNIEWFKKIKAGYKVLIKGNHDDKGDKYYKRSKCNIIIPIDFYLPSPLDNEELINVQREQQVKYPADKVTVYEEFDTTHAPFHYFKVVVDNCLFDEVYAGPLWIAPKILLSHEPIDLPFILDIHGHNHCADMVDEILFKPNSLNIAADNVNFEVISLKDIIKAGAVSNIKDIHRVTIDRAGEK